MRVLICFFLTKCALLGALEPTENKNKSIVENFFRALNNKNYKWIRSSLDRNFQIISYDQQENLNKRPLPHHNVLIQKWENLLRSVPDYVISVHDIVCEGDKVIVHYSITGRQNTTSKDCKEMLQIRSFSLFTFEKEKIKFIEELNTPSLFSDTP